jgi:Domain of unknown function (DUF4129)
MNGEYPDSLRAVLDSVFAAPAYRWVQRPDPFAALRHFRDAIWHWLETFHDAHPLGFRAVLYAMVAVMIAIVIHAGWTFIRSVRAADASPEASRARFIPRDQAWYRREADRLAAAGHFAEAIQADFLALVLALDARHVLRFHPSKTPGEYTREPGLAPGSREEFRDLVRRLYRYAFARSSCGPADFSDWRERATPERYAPAN